VSEDPCINERENYEAAVVAAVTAIGAGVAGAPATLGASIIVGLLIGAGAGYAVGTTQKQLARCLRNHGLSAEADVLEETGERLEQELAALTAEAEANASAMA